VTTVITTKTEEHNMSPTQQSFRRMTWSAAVFLLAVPVQAEESRFRDVRLIVGRSWNGGFDEAKGVLISDTGARRLRFDVGGQSLLDVRFDQLRAARYGQSKYPPRRGRRSSGGIRT
jgi:hypothetical protein